MTPPTKPAAARELEAFTAASLAVEKHRSEYDGDHEGPSGAWLGTWDRLRAVRKAAYDRYVAALKAAHDGGGHADA